MSEKKIKEAIENKKILCPDCSKPIQKYSKYSETIDAVRDGFNIVEIDSNSSRVTLTCGNDSCEWEDRTEYWEGLIEA